LPPIYSGEAGIEETLEHRASLLLFPGPQCKIDFVPTMLVYICPLCGYRFGSDVLQRNGEGCLFFCCKEDYLKLLQSKYMKQEEADLGAEHPMI
jgi:hypothetical protein